MTRFGHSHVPPYHFLLVRKYWIGSQVGFSKGETIIAVRYHWFGSTENKTTIDLNVNLGQDGELRASLSNSQQAGDFITRLKVNKEVYDKV